MGPASGAYILYGAGARSRAPVLVYPCHCPPPRCRVSGAIFFPFFSCVRCYFYFFFGGGLSATVLIRVVVCQVLRKGGKDGGRRCGVCVYFCVFVCVGVCGHLVSVSLCLPLCLSLCMGLGVSLGLGL